jgi:hypothetical protein
VKYILWVEIDISFEKPFKAFVFDSDLIVRGLECVKISYDLSLTSVFTLVVPKYVIR